jgi:DNA polymerase IV
MALPINRNQPLLMHVDLNSCFATIEQQANPLLRGKPIVVAAYNSPKGTVVAPSIEAKRYGIKTGMRVMDAKLLYPNVIVRTPDPAKYRAVHLQFRTIFKGYSPDVSPKSIDEAVIDFTDTYALYNRSLTDIGREIKRRFREEIGEWMVCSIGIGPNRFLAKLAASLQKPDGLTVIDHTNVLKVYQAASLLDLNGINTRYQARLNAYGIHTPMEFFRASLDTLKKQVFQSIVGYYWYLRLRGYEIDEVDFARKSFGNTYALGKQTNDPKELARLLMKLCEKTGRRLRRAAYAATGVHVACVYTDFSSWHTGRKVEIPVYTTREIYLKALWLLNGGRAWPSQARMADPQRTPADSGMVAAPEPVGNIVDGFQLVHYGHSQVDDGRMQQLLQDWSAIRQYVTEQQQSQSRG